MVYDPNRQYQDPWSVGNSFVGDVTPSPPGLAANGGPYGFADLFGPATRQQPSIANPPRSEVGQMNLGLPTAPPVTQAGQPFVPPTVDPQQQFQLPSSEQTGPVGTILGGLASIPGQVLPIPDFLSQHLINFGKLVGGVFDWPLKQLPTLGFLPGGQDLQQSFAQMPETPEKKQFEAALSTADPVNQAHFMAQYIRQYQQEYSAATGRNRALINIDTPSDSLAGQVAGLLGTLGVLGQVVQRTFVGSSVRNVMGTVINNPDYAHLAPELQTLREQFLDHKISIDQLYDDISTSPYKWTNQQGLGGTAASFFLDLFTDPLVVGTFGLGGAAKAVETGAVAERGLEAANLLRASDPVGYASAVQKAGTTEGAAIADVMRTTHPDLLRQVDQLPKWAGQDVTLKKRALVSLQPILRPAADLANELQNPLGWLGLDRVGRAISSKIVHNGMDGTVNALGAPDLLAISKATGIDQGRLAVALGNFHANMVNKLHQSNLVREIQRSRINFFEGVPSFYAKARGTVSTISSEMEDLVRFHSRDVLPRTRVGKGAVEEALKTERVRAANMLQDLGATPEAALSLTQNASHQRLAAIHALNYGRAAGDFAKSKDEAIRQAEARWSASPPKDQAEADARAADLELMKRHTLISERELTDVAAKEVLQMVKDKDMVGLKDAIERYTVLAQNLGNARLPDEIMLVEAEQMLTTLLDTSDGKQRLVHLLDANHLDEPLKTWAKEEMSRYGDQAYRVGMAPNDPWSYIHSPTGDTIGAHPWMDVVGGSENTWLPTTADRLRLGMFTPIRGNRLMQEAQRTFMQDSIEHGLTHSQSNALFVALRESATEQMTGPRGLSVEDMWDTALRTKGVPMDVMAKIGDRGLAKMFVQAWEGELKTVGVSTKLSSKLKTLTAARGNYIGRVAEKFYPLARFYLSPFFLAQEWLEGPFFNILRGNKPGFIWNERDIKTRALIERVNDHSRFTDQFEYLFFHRVLEGETSRIAGPSSRFARVGKKLDGMNIHQQKYLNYMRQWARDGADQMHDSFESVQPGLWHLMEQEYGSVNRVDVMLQYLSERGMGRETSPRLGVTNMDRMKPPDFGKAYLVLDGDTAREHNFQNVAEMRKAVRLGTYTFNDFKTVEDRMTSHPEWIKQAYAILERPPADEFAQLWISEGTKGGMADGLSRSDAEARAKVYVGAAMSYVREHAKTLGVPVDEWLANKVVGVKYLNNENLLPTGSLAQHVKANVEAMRGTYYGPTSPRHEKLMAASAAFGPEALPNEVLSAANSQSDSWFQQADGGHATPVEPGGVPFSRDQPLVILDTYSNSGNAYNIVNGKVDPTSIAERMDTFIEPFIGKGAIDDAKDWKSHAGSMMLALVDKMDETTVQLALKAAGADLSAIDSTDIALMRDELAARLLASVGASRLDGNMVAGLDYAMYALDELTRGERNGISPLSPEGRALIDRVVKQGAPISDLGNTAMVHDYFDSITGRSSRSVGLPGQPAAPDLYAYRSLGFVDKQFLFELGSRATTYMERLTKRRQGGLTEPQRQTLEAASVDEGRRAVPSLTDDAYNALPDTLEPTAFQHEWAVQYFNREAQWANDTNWHGHSDWRAADFAAIHSMHGHRMVGKDALSPSDIFANEPTWSMSSEVLPSPHSVHDHELGQALPQFEQLPGEKSPNLSTSPTPNNPQANKRPLLWGAPESMPVYKDMANFYATRLAAESGVSVLGHYATTGERPHGGSMPNLLVNFDVMGHDAQIDTALNQLGHMAQQDSVMATQHWLDRTQEPTFAHPTAGTYWAMDFKPEVEDREVLEALARYLSHKDGYWADHFVLARDNEGNHVVRALWTKDVKAAVPGGPVDYESFKAAVPVHSGIANAFLDLDMSKNWLNVSGLMPGEAMTVSYTPRVVKVKMAKNMDYVSKDAESVFNLRHQATQADQFEMDRLQDRMAAMRAGGFDPFGGGYQMGQVKEQLNALAPGKSLYSGSNFWGHIGPDAEVVARRQGQPLDPHGPPWSVVIVKRPARSSGTTSGWVLVRNAAGDDWVGGMNVEFNAAGGIYEIHYTSLNDSAIANSGERNKGSGTKFYDAIAEQHPELTLWNGVGASGNFSDVGGAYAYRWLEHRFNVLQDKTSKFSSFEWQNQQAVELAQRTGISLDEARAQLLGKPYLDRLRKSGRADIAERLVTEHGPDATTVLGDSLRRHAPGLFAVNQGNTQGVLRWSRAHALDRTGASGGPPTGRTLYQRGPSGIRGATAWNHRRESTSYVLKNYDATTALHETFHWFVEDLHPSAKKLIREEYLKENPHVDPNSTPDWNVDMEEWAADKWELFIRDPSSQMNPQLGAVTNMFTKFAADKGWNAVLPGDLNPTLAKVFQEATGRDYTPAVTFNADEQRLWETARISLLKAEEQAHTTHYYARGRAWMQRSLNHPYLGLYPLSYMWGKVVPEMFRFLVKQPFGLKAPLGGLLMAKDVMNSLQLQMQTDPGFSKWVSDHPQTIQFLQLMLPGTPWETPVNLPVVWRRGIQNYITNEQRVAAGHPEQQKPFDILSALQDMSQYSVGVFRFLGQADQILGEFNPQTATPTAPTGVSPAQQLGLPPTP